MSERYGTINEVYERMPDFEDWVREEIDTAIEIISQDAPTSSATAPRFLAGRILALHEVLTWWGVNDR